jgi:mannose-1-phosphate guanylyltransferase
MTDHLAKALVPVGDRPMLGHVLDRLRGSGVTRLVVNAHHRAEDVVSFASGQRDVAVSREPELLGTAGGLASAATLLGGGSVLVWNADILADVDARSLVTAHETGAAGPLAMEATLVVQPRDVGEGSIGIDRDGTIVRLRRERIADESRGGEFLGIHVVGEVLRRALPARGCLVADVYIPAMRRGARLGTMFHHGTFFDVGTRHGYIEANLAWLRARAGSHWVGAGAQVGPEVILEQAVVGQGARVLGVGRVVRSVVWPGAVAVAPLSDAVVTTVT